MKIITHENQWWWGKSYDIILGGGVAIVELQMEDESPLNAYVRGLSVVLDERRKGWAKKLLTTCEDIARLNKKSYLYLCVDKGNIWLTEFYKNQGFKVTHVDEHEYQMTKYLSPKII